jgi:transcriptional repressor NrdR
MKCPFCRETTTEVYNSRNTKSGNQIWRRRRCKNCGKVFTTYEYIDLTFVSILKRSGKMEPYSRAKLYSSLYNAFAGSPFDQSTIDAITDTVETKVLDNGKTVLEANELAHIALVTLKHFNGTAFLRYLSLQTDLASSSQIKKELKKYQ